MLLEILSFLDMKHAVQTSILSKRWRDLWTSLRSLTFDKQLFYSPKNEYWCDDFLNFVDQVLLLRDNSDIDKFHLINLCKDYEIESSRLNTWFISVIRRKVQQFHIELYGEGIRLPNSLFTCNTLTRLILWICHNERWSITLPAAGMSLPNLWDLQLHSLSFHDENLTNNFFLSCPNLKRLVLGDVEFLHMNVHISCLELRHLTIYNHGLQGYGYCRWPDSKLELYAPNLECIGCQDFMSKDYTLNNFASLLEADIDMKVEEEEENPGIYLQLPAKKKQIYGQQMMEFLRRFHNVEVLTLSAWFLEVVSGDTDFLGSLASQFCNLKHLNLKIWLSRDSIHAVTYLLKISPIMESLLLEISKIELSSTKIEDCQEEGLSMDSSLYHLKFVEIRGLVGCAIELNFLEMLLKNAMTMEKLVVFTSKEDSSPDREKQLMKFSEKLLEFPRASTSIGILFF